MKIIKKLIFFLSVVLILISMFYFVCYLLPGPKINKPNQINVIDRTGKVVFSSCYEKEGEYLTLNDINTDFIDCFIASEDENFYEHLGFSLKGVSRALINNIKSDNKQGGSTISQQVSRSVFLDNEKSIVRKIKEAIYTVRIETHYDKNYILEIYLNNIFLGHNIYGIQQASNYYFSKDNKKLTLDEVAMIVGIANAPNLNAPDINYENAIKRRNYVLKRLVDLSIIDDQEYNFYLNKQTSINISKTSFTSHNTHIYYYIKNQLDKLNLNSKKVLANGLNVYTTIDDDIQKQLFETISKNNPKDNSQIASVIMKANSSDVLAMIGGYDINDQYNRSVLSIRPIGSTIKPVLYYLALKAKLSPDTFINCNEKTFNVKGYEPYTPKNASNKYAKNPINMIEAIGLSDNIYATKTLLYIGFDNFEKMLNKFNIDTNVVLSSALGVDETSLLNLTSIYNCFASLGVYYVPRIISKITDLNGNIYYINNQSSTRKLERPYVFLLNQLLTSPFDENLIDYTKPTLLEYKTNNTFAAKTGSDEYNSYVIGYNPDYVISTWAGTDNNEKFYSKNVCKKVFKEMANKISKENKWYNPPSYIEVKNINPITAKYSKTGSVYWFLKDY